MTQRLCFQTYQVISLLTTKSIPGLYSCHKFFDLKVCNKSHINSYIYFSPSILNRRCKKPFLIIVPTYVILNILSLSTVTKGQKNWSARAAIFVNEPRNSTTRPTLATISTSLSRFSIEDAKNHSRSFFPNCFRTCRHKSPPFFQGCV